MVKLEPTAPPRQPTAAVSSTTGISRARICIFLAIFTFDANSVHAFNQKGLNRDF
jgi:hypothetical protein